MKLLSILRTFDKKQRTGYLTYIKLYHKPDSVLFKIASWLDSKSIWKAEKVLTYTTEMLRSELPFEMKPQSFSNAITTLGNLAEEYVGWMVWKGSPSLKRSCQLTGLAQKSLSDEYIKTQKEVLLEPKHKVISIWDEHHKMLTFFNDYYFGISPSVDNYTEEFKRLISSFKKSVSSIAQFLVVEIRNRENLLSESWSHDEDFFGLLYQQETELKYITDNLISMNYNGEVAAYNFLRNILYSNKIESLSSHIKYSIVTYCIIFLSKSIKKGEIYRGQELLDLYEFSLEKGIFTLNEKMNITKFLNIIGVASKLKKYEWARKIVDNWAQKVDEFNYKSITKLGHATIDFHQKEYERVVQTLIQLKSTNFQHRLRSRLLLLKAQFAINKEYIEVLKVQVDNFRRFIISNESKINKPAFEGLKATIRILKMLLNKKPPNYIMNYYKTSINIFERKWILEEIKNPVR